MMDSWWSCHGEGFLSQPLTSISHPKYEVKIVAFNNFSGILVYVSTWYLRMDFTYLNVGGVLVAWAEDGLT